MRCEGSASFPYGAKTKAELTVCVSWAIARLAGMGAVAVVLASNAPSVMVLEEGTFLSDRLATVRSFLEELRQAVPGLDVCTLSSTHLPWLTPLFQEAAPDITFLDPAESLIPQLRPYATQGSGRMVCIATESPSMPLSGLQRMLDRLGVSLEPRLVHP